MNDFHYHLHQRGLRPWHRAWVDDEQELVTFPLFTFDKLIGYQRYNWREIAKKNNGGRYFTWISDAYKTCSCYGLHELRGYGPLFIVEGIWDSLAIKNCWHDSIAVLSNNPHRQLIQWIKNVFRFRTTIAILDNDANNAGNKLAKVADFAFHVPHTVKDMGELDEREAFHFLDEVISKVSLTSSTRLSF